MELSSIILISFLIVLSLITVTIFASYVAFKFSSKRQCIYPRQVYGTQSKTFIYKD
jgi:lipopolysaccharide/colanic/teichoic acid biosynthesis glycosyltransferase